MNYSPSACQPSVIVRISSSSNASSGNGIPGLFVEMQGKRLTLEASEPMPVSAVVTVECDDAMFLGEVAAVTPQNGRYYLEIAVEQVLTGLQSLLALRAQLLGEGAPAPRVTQNVSDFQTA